MSEVVFLVDDTDEGYLAARAVGPSIFTEADDREALCAAVRDAVCCHFADADMPERVRLRFSSDEVILWS